MDDERAPDSPIKIRREVAQPTKTVNHFSRRYHSKLSDSDVFAVRFSPDASMAAVSTFDGSLHLVSTMMGDNMYEIKDE